jgi:hypothetical protein
MIMSTKDFIPQADRLFLVWIKTLYANLQQRGGAWNVPQAEIIELNSLLTAFVNALAITDEPSTRTKVTVKTKNVARKSLESKARMTVKAYLIYNPLVSDSEREAMNLPIHKTSRTPADIPRYFPEVEVRMPSPGVIEIHFRDSQTGKRLKPAGVHGVEIVWVISGKPPVDWKELLHSVFCTRTPLRLTFEGPERGQTVYFALRWENTRGEKGPWTEILSAIIP